jgi:hypothetical protein
MDHKGYLLLFFGHIISCTHTNFALTKAFAAVLPCPNLPRRSPAGPDRLTVQKDIHTARAFGQSITHGLGQGSKSFYNEHYKRPG